MACDHASAIELAREGRWGEAHSLVQRCSDRLSCLIHGYLHRVEGDRANAAYWYRRAGESLPANTLDEELARLAEQVEHGVDAP